MNLILKEPNDQFQDGLGEEFHPLNSQSHPRLHTMRKRNTYYTKYQRTFFELQQCHQYQTSDYPMVAHW